MNWWKATSLGTLVYVGISLVLSVLAFILGILLAAIPVAGIFLALLLNLATTFAQSVFSGFIAGNLSNKHKIRAGVLSAFFGSIIESLIRILLFTFVPTILIGGIPKFVQIPLELVRGGVWGSFYVALIGVMSIIIACFAGYLGVRVSLELPLRKIRKEIKKKIKV